MWCIPHCRGLFVIRWAFNKEASSVNFIVDRFSLPNSLILNLSLCVAHTLVFGQLTSSLEFLTVWFVVFSLSDLPNHVRTTLIRRRAPSNRAVQVSASSQPPNKPLRTRDPVQTANLTDKAHPSWPNHQLQHLLSAPQPIRQNLQFQHMLLALPTRNCDGMAERSKAMRSGRRVLLSLPWHHRYHFAAGYECPDTASVQHPKY